MSQTHNGALDGMLDDLPSELVELIGAFLLDDMPSLLALTFTSTKFHRLLTNETRGPISTLVVEAGANRAYSLALWLLETFEIPMSYYFSSGFSFRGSQYYAVELIEILATFALRDNDFDMLRRLDSLTWRNKPRPVEIKIKESGEETEGDEKEKGEEKEGGEQTEGREVFPVHISYHRIDPNKWVLWETLGELGSHDLFDRFLAFFGDKIQLNFDCIGSFLAGIIRRGHLELLEWFFSSYYVGFRMNGYYNYGMLQSSMSEAVSPKSIFGDIHARSVDCFRFVLMNPCIELNMPRDAITSLVERGCIEILEELSTFLQLSKSYRSGDYVTSAAVNDQFEMVEYLVKSVGLSVHPNITLHKALPKCSPRMVKLIIDLNGGSFANFARDESEIDELMTNVMKSPNKEIWELFFHELGARCLKEDLFLSLCFNRNASLAYDFLIANHCPFSLENIIKKTRDIHLHKMIPLLIEKNIVLPESILDEFRKSKHKEAASGEPLRIPRSEFLKIVAKFEEPSTRSVFAILNARFRFELSLHLLPLLFGRNRKIPLTLSSTSPPILALMMKRNDGTIKWIRALIEEGGVKVTEEAVRFARERGDVEAAQFLLALIESPPVSTSD